MEKKENNSVIIIGTTTVLVNVGSTSPLVLNGTVERISPLELCERKHDDDDTVCIPGNAEIEGEQEFLIIRVTSAILPQGFPLTIAQLVGMTIAINLNFVIMVFPVSEVG